MDGKTERLSGQSCGPGLDGGRGKRTVIIAGRPLQSQQTLVHVDADVRLPDQSHDEVVGEARVGGLHLGERGPQSLAGGHILLVQLARHTR